MPESKKAIIFNELRQRNGKAQLFMGFDVSLFYLIRINRIKYSEPRSRKCSLFKRIISGLVF